MNASISGAEVMSQAKWAWPAPWRQRVWRNCRGVKPWSRCVAAEIGMEHNLGLTRTGCRSGAGAVH